MDAATSQTDPGQDMVRPMESFPLVTLAKDLRQAIRSGHPWLYDRALARKQPRLQPGQRVRVAYAGTPVAVGYANPGSPIAVRVLGLDPDEPADAAWAGERAYQAARSRVGDPLLTRTTGVRVIHGENDFMPGLVVDLYDDTAVVVFDGAAAAAFWEPLMDAVVAGIARAGLAVARYWLRPVKDGTPAGPGDSAPAGRVLRGDEPPEIIVIEEEGARFEVDVRRGQKTGFFLDQRPNRSLVRDMAAGLRVLNLFSYTGGFSVQAALGGARRVTSVDVSGPAMEGARRNFARNGLDPAAHGFVTEDAFDYLDAVHARGERFELVIVDPPSFAPNARSKPRALKAYTALNRLALRAVEPGGWMLSASCSSHVTVQDMMSILAAAGELGGRRLRILQVRGAGSDHPILPAFPEGHYLKVLLLGVE